MKTNNHQHQTSASKTTRIIYWIATGLVLLETTVGAYWDLFQIPFVLNVFKTLGYPSYFLIYMGIAKILGVIVFFLPGLSRLREWVYAGLFFTYAGAAFSHIAIGSYVHAIDPLVFTGLTITSWALRPRLQKAAVLAYEK